MFPYISQIAIVHLKPKNKYMVLGEIDKLTAAGTKPYLTGTIHSQTPGDIHTGIFQDSATGKWLYVEHGEVKINETSWYDSLEECLDIETLWNAMHKEAAARGSNIRHYTPREKESITDAHMAFLRQTQVPLKNLYIKGITFIVELDSSRTDIDKPLSCFYFDIDGTDVKKVEVWSSPY